MQLVKTVVSKKFSMVNPLDVCTTSIDVNGETKILEITTTPMKDSEGNVDAALELATGCN